MNEEGFDIITLLENSVTINFLTVYEHDGKDKPQNILTTIGSHSMIMRDIFSLFLD